MKWNVVQVSDLGVTVDSRLKFSAHISNICCKAHKRANLSIRCFHSKNVSSLITAFKVYVRPILEYCSVVWNPFLIKDINAIEAVQRRFTKRLPGMKHLTYHQRLVKLELESLELRRVRTDLLCVYKLFSVLLTYVCQIFLCRSLMMPEESIDTNCTCHHVGLTYVLTVLTIERYVLGTVYQQMWILLL